ncbi:DUF6233 domain-containing protein [Streptomyces sp. NPDC012751]|uniref:DUF6233 domain-containing protein n=1 Tax=Streptomyces sp. NPDC012751 TaxID=3364846 RepID=UPI0036A1A34E
MPSAPEPVPVPVPIRVLLPGDQEVVAHLWSRRQARDGWRYEVGLPAYRNGPGDTVEPAEYLERPSPVQEALGPRQPVGWVLAKAGGRGPGRGGVVHAVDCEEAPAGAPVLPLDRALDTAEQPGMRLCSLCGAAAELDPVLKGFGEGFGEQ